MPDLTAVVLGYREQSWSQGWHKSLMPSGNCDAPRGTLLEGEVVPIASVQGQSQELLGLELTEH